MITFKKYILEAGETEFIYKSHIAMDVYDDDGYLKKSIVDDIVSILTRDCQPWISELRHPTIALPYRGIPGARNALLLKKNTRRDRRPKDTNKNLHDLWDDWFESKFGFRARSESIFITGNRTEALMYGDAYLVYPIGPNFNYLACGGIRDLTNNFSTMYRQAARNDREYEERRIKSNTPGFEKNITEDEVFQTMDSEAKYILNRDLSKHISKNINTEVMVQCSEYYALYAESLEIVKPILEML